MKKNLLFLLFLITLPSVFSLYEEKIFEGTIQSGDQFKINNKTYEIYHNRRKQTTVIFFPEGYNDVINNENESCSEEWIYRTCVSNIKFSLNGMDVPTEIHQENLDITMNLKLFASYANLKIKRQIEKTRLFSGEKANIETIIENDGELTAEEVFVSDSFPSSVSLLNAVGCDIKDNSIIWKGGLEKGKRKRCTYEITAEEEDEFDSILHVNYSFLDREVHETDKQKIIIRKSPLAMNISLKNKTVRPEETQRLEIRLIPDNSLEINSLIVYVPEELRIINHSKDLKKTTGGNLRYTGEIEAEQVFFAEFKSKLIGNHSVKAETIFSYNGITRNLTDKKQISIFSERFLIWAEQKENQTIIKINNPHEDEFFEIEIDVLSDRKIIETFEIAKLKPKRYKEFILPNQKYIYEIRYRTLHGQILNFSSDLNIQPYQQIDTKEDLPEEKKEPIIDTAEEKEKFSLNFSIDRNIALIIGAVVLIIIVFFKFIVLGGSDDEDLDSEIDRIREETEK
ncbi:hypothetical protein GF327_07400 [Candidatus Woesearchaeota archaeon]|nr:hypothetical protein [Candidatus Woesearchaeota archaeon]